MRICKDLSLQDFTNYTKQCIYCHTERSEVSKSRESKTNSESMTQKRISESHRFAKSKQITNDSKVAKMDSSRCRAQNDESCGLPRLDFVKSRNDDSLFRLCEAIRTNRRSKPKK